MSETVLELISSTVEETEAAGARLAEILKADPSLPRFVAMYGDLGSGKTAFTRGFASLASPSSAVRSPTFTIVNEYRNGDVPVFHFDMYRIGDEDELYSIGFYDYLSKGFCLCEWSENIADAVPADAYIVTITRTDGENGRRIEIDYENSYWC